VDDRIDGPNVFGSYLLQATWVKLTAAADVLGISPTSAERWWAYARA
jgi:hypothetical protein